MSDISSEPFITTYTLAEKLAERVFPSHGILVLLLLSLIKEIVHSSEMINIIHVLFLQRLNSFALA